MHEVDGLSCREESADNRVRLCELHAQHRPGLLVSQASLELLIHLAEIRRAVEVAQDRVTPPELGHIRVLLQLDEEKGEDANTGVFGRDRRVASISKHGDVDRDGSLLGHAESGEETTEGGIDTAESFVDNEGDAVLAVAREELESERFGRPTTTNLFIGALQEMKSRSTAGKQGAGNFPSAHGRYDDGAAKHKGSALTSRRAPRFARHSPSRLESISNEFLDSGEDTNKL